MGPITPIVMPKWGLEMREGTVQDWLVREGDRIEVGTALLDVDTDKISNSVEAPDAGLLRRIVAQSGETLPVKALLGVLAEHDVSDAEIEAYVGAYEVPAVGSGDEDAGPAFDYAEVDGIRVRYARRGPESGTPVLFIHGFGGDLNNWLFNLDAVAEKHPVIALDLPAHGQSQVKLAGTTLQELAAFVGRFMETIGVPSAHLVGHSMGGGVAAQLAVDAPQKARSLALIDSAGLGDEVNADYTDGFVRAESRRELKPVAELLFNDTALVSRQMLDDLLKYKRLDGVAEALTALGTALFGDGRQREQPGKALGGFDGPVLVVWGREDRVIPSAHAAAAPAGAVVAVLDDAGHMPQMEKANEVNALLRRHLGQ
ncbi:MAG: acetoin dehydrogenase dihydrolipoyllysine-residue acetyltransferase subunit [Paraburkholderia sp.]|uniref:acetoin dehydrogenase dihydrolipoyllysine-residue acetyltransferase subunit n=1 Tax=Paraburkholderia sp. TaxID=1926495 RepID=UPI001226D00B|nr:acetoin dehydrogenase dihydrolipoyllysine-residue acetyltransferase subunit [Paraburkholderia sp.]TAM01668.1 MAG: acetoin dehydrogenase dihydrolipoyllysine-residue acetyltransferase subunit [Paraburkholderia sp.]TAM29916.1 MAG: acetoin dehydrogenase dihydrolipoyllysine-residue acetyltransferase subunit [Paraburkholderia sp.]